MKYVTIVNYTLIIQRQYLALFCDQTARCLYLFPVTVSETVSFHSASAMIWNKTENVAFGEKIDNLTFFFAIWVKVSTLEK